MLREGWRSLGWNGSDMGGVFISCFTIKHKDNFIFLIPLLHQTSRQIQEVSSGKLGLCTCYPYCCPWSFQENFRAVFELNYNKFLPDLSDSLFVRYLIVSCCIVWLMKTL
jgi:hypothetical protein